MEFFQIINIFANVLICMGMTGFFVLLYGNEHSIVQKWNIVGHWTLKATLVTIIAASAWNAMNVVYKMIIPRGDDIVAYSQTPIGEIVLNIGLAFLFAWVVYFHKFHFLKVAPAKKGTAPKKAVPSKKKVIKKK